MFSLNPKTAVRRKDEVVLASLAGLSGSTGILGGTFDPPHRAHVELARAVMKARGLRCVVFVPAAQNPLKGRKPLASNEDRLQMLYLALRAERDLFASPIELEAGGNSYTFQTLRQIRAAAPAAQLYLIFGSDCLPDLPRWKNLPDICADAALIPVSRQGQNEADFDALRAVLPAAALADMRRNYLSGFLFPLSASSVRQNLQRGEDVSDSLDPAVYDYIKERGLYRLP